MATCGMSCEREQEKRPAKLGVIAPVMAPKPKEKPVSGLPVGGQQRGITALCSSQTRLLGAKTIRQLVQGGGHIPVALFQNR